MITVSEADYNEVLKIRQQVMYPDKSIDEVKIDNDNMGIHLGVFDDGNLMTIASIFLDKERNLQFRKLATHVEVQGKGYATEFMKWLDDYAKDVKLNSVWCNARKDVIGFYKKFGYEETNETFSRDGYDYIVMRKKFQH